MVVVVSVTILPLWPGRPLSEQRAIPPAKACPASTRSKVLFSLATHPTSTSMQFTISEMLVPHHGPFTLPAAKNSCLDKLTPTGQQPVATHSFRLLLNAGLMISEWNCTTIWELCVYIVALTFVFVLLAPCTAMYSRKSEYFFTFKGECTTIFLFQPSITLQIASLVAV